MIGLRLRGPRGQMMGLRLRQGPQGTDDGAETGGPRGQMMGLRLGGPEDS